LAEAAGLSKDGRGMAVAQHAVMTRMLQVRVRVENRETPGLVT
jgi:hypothetical protein